LIIEYKQVPLSSERGTLDTVEEHFDRKLIPVARINEKEKEEKC